MICRNDHCYAFRAQKPHFCVKTTKNLGKIAHSDTRMPILCSKGRKMGVPKPKSAQKCRFCARRASRNSTERPSAAGKNLPKRNKTAWDEAQRPEAQRNATATQRTQHTQRNRHATQRNRSVTRNATATQPLRQRQGTATQWHNKKGDNLSGCLL